MNDPKEIKKLLNSLQYCNDFIKCCKTTDYKKIISNTKFYALKNCVINYLLRNSEELGITFGQCVMQPQKEHTLVFIPIIYNDTVYGFHQLYEDIEWSLIESEVDVDYKDEEYIRPIKQIESDIDKFERGITLIKHYIWCHYKKTLADPNAYINKPMKYMSMVELCNKHLKFEIFLNGALMKYHITARLRYKGEIVAQKPLTKIRKNIFQYIALNNKNK